MSKQPKDSGFAHAADLIALHQEIFRRFPAEIAEAERRGDIQTVTRCKRILSQITRLRLLRRWPYNEGKS